MNSYKKKSTDAQQSLVNDQIAKQKSSNSKKLPSSPGLNINQNNLQTLINNSPKAGNLKSVQLMADNYSRQASIQMKGSHGKMKVFRIIDVELTDMQTNTKSIININYNEDLGEVNTHGDEPANKGYQYAKKTIKRNNLLPRPLGPREGITNINFEHYTRKT